jgi:hypothetical protein
MVNYKKYLLSLVLGSSIMVLLYFPFNWIDSRYGYLKSLGIYFRPVEISLIQWISIIILIIILSNIILKKIFFEKKLFILLSTPILSLVLFLTVDYMLSDKMELNIIKVKIVKDDEFLGWKYIPNSNNNNGIYINSNGFRGPELSKRNTLFIGNSVTFAQHVNHEETFVSLLDGINGGVDGYNTMQERDYLINELNYLNPKIIVLIITPGDVKTEKENNENIRNTLSSSRLISKKSLSFNNYFNKISMQSNIYNFLNLELEENQNWKDNIYLDYMVRNYSKEKWKEWTNAILDIQMYSIEKNAQLLVVLSPPRSAVRKFQETNKEFRFSNELMQFCMQNKIQFFDLLPKLSRYSADDLYYDFVHYSVYGHYIVAESIRENQLIK